MTANQPQTASRHGKLASASAAFLVLAMLSASANGGPIFFRGEVREGKFVPAKAAARPADPKATDVRNTDAKNADAKQTEPKKVDAKAPPAPAAAVARTAPENEPASQCVYSVRYSSITATADDRSARVEIVESIEGPDKAVKTVCLIPLPATASAEGITVTVAESAGEPAAIKSARFLTAEEAQKMYEQISRGLDSVAVLALTGQPAVLIPEYALQGKRTFSIAFRQAVRQEQGVLSLDCPMPATRWTHGPVPRVTLTASVESTQPLRAMFSPTHSAAIERSGLQKATVRVKAADWAGDDDFRLCWVADKDALGLRVLTFREEGEDDGYFMLLANPTGSDEKPIDKEVLFVLDTSGSMRGEKMEQARAAIDYCVTHLNAGDRFNIVTFGTEVESFREAPVAATKDSLAAAREYVERLIARGRTNISGAWRRPSPPRPRRACRGS